MYTQNPVKDTILFSKAVLSNQVARFAPGLYVSLTRQTGRGKQESAQSAATYFIDCFFDYQKNMGLDETGFASFLKGKTVLEYGPGDVLGTALLFYANGARKVHCVDRFPLSSLSEKNIKIYTILLDLLDGKHKDRAAAAFKEKGNPESGFDDKAICYKVTEDGLSGGTGKYDLIISRAVLEHVNHLEKTMHDIKGSLRDGGISLHQVDLKSHGLDRYTDFDFLTWPTSLYNIMYSHKGFPNRMRINKYREFTQKSGLRIKQLTPTGRIDPKKLDLIYDKTAREFKGISLDELSWQGFWIHLVHDGPETGRSL